MLSRNHPDRIQITFDDRRLVANAGLLLPVTLAQHLALRELVDHHLDLGGAPGRANTGDKMLTLVASALAGGDCIDDDDMLRTGGTAIAIGCMVKAPSTLGTFLRSFRWGHASNCRPTRCRREDSAAWAAGDAEANEFYVYILKLNDGSFYAGQTREFRERLMEHRDGMTKSTARRDPRLVWFATVPTREQAADYEVQFKRVCDQNPPEIRRWVRRFQDLVEELNFD